MSMYTRKDSGELGGLFLLHCVYYMSLCDLYRISMPMLLPGVFKKLSPIDSSSDQRSFRDEFQRKCFEHAKSVARILAKAVEHGTRFLSDTWLCTCAYESIRTMLYYSVHCVGLRSNTSNERQLVLEIVPLFRINMEALKLMIPLYATAEHCVRIQLDNISHMESADIEFKV